jgi:geranylgeranyl diphosphate synthase, type II
VADDLRAFLRAKQTLVEDRLDALLRKETGCPDELSEAMRYSLMAPGKRLRPMLVIMAAEAAGGRDEVALPAACAVEMIHTYSLIHDDLPAMDDDDLRRGQPTCHKQFGEALAILAGDALLTLAFQVLAESYPAATAAGCCKELARGAGAAGMVGGQVEDLAGEESKIADSRLQIADLNGKSAICNLQSQICAQPQSARPRSLSTLEHIHALKTGALFRACLRLGVWTAQGERPGGPDTEVLARLDQYGRCFGMVFQITDDLLDVEGNAEDTGKRVQKDAARGKLTYPGFLGVADSRRRARQLGQEGQDCLRLFAAKGERLAELLRFVVERDR